MTSEYGTRRGVAHALTQGLASSSPRTLKASPAPLTLLTASTMS